MSEHGLTVGFGAALLEQLRWFWHRLWIWIVIVTVLTAGASAWIISSIPDTEGEEGPMIATMLVGNAFHPLLVLIAISWALSAWRDDPPKERQYFWLHPVNRTAHVVARSLAGFIWLVLVMAIVIATTVISANVFLGGAPGLDAPRIWGFAVASIALAYISSSIAPILSDRPAIWIILVVALVIIAGVIADIRDLAWLQRGLDVLTGGARSFGTALGAPGYAAAHAVMGAVPEAGSMDVPQMDRIMSAQPGDALLIWLPISIVAFLGSALISRPR